jgi:hypothetical protein
MKMTPNLVRVANLDVTCKWLRAMVLRPIWFCTCLAGDLVRDRTRTSPRHPEWNEDKIAAMTRPSAASGAPHRSRTTDRSAG